MIGYFVEQVLAVYGLLSNLHEGFAINNAVFVTGAAIFSWLIFVTCNTAQRATEEVGAGFVRVFNDSYSTVVGYRAWDGKVILNYGSERNWECPVLKKPDFRLRN